MWKPLQVCLGSSTTENKQKNHFDYNFGMKIARAIFIEELWSIDCNDPLEITSDPWQKIVLTNDQEYAMNSEVEIQ